MFLLLNICFKVRIYKYLNFEEYDNFFRFIDIFLVYIILNDFVYIDEIF